MVLRERKINYKADEIQVHCSFALPDVKAMLRLYAEMCEEIRDLPHTEKDVCEWLQNDGRAFLSWPARWRGELSKWAFAVAVRNNLLIPSATGKNIYYLSETLFARRGRPKKDD
jgi:hypothetical protein